MKLRAAVVAAMTFALPATASLADRHTVTVSGANPDRIHVDSVITLCSDLIGLLITKSDQLPNGQADLVRNLSVKDASGEPVPAQAVPGGDWKLAGAGAGDVVSVAYDILLEHQKYRWGPGMDEVAYTTDDGLFFTGASLFMTSGMENTENIAVEFVLQRVGSRRHPGGRNASTILHGERWISCAIVCFWGRTPRNP